MKNMNVIAVVAAVAASTAMPLSAFAASVIKSSTASVAADQAIDTAGYCGTDEPDQPAGEDTNQNQKTAYADPIAEDKTSACDVYASQASTFSVTIPKVIILNGAKGAENSGAYTVKASGNIGGNETISVTPAAAFKMRQTGKTDIDAAVAQAVTKFVVAQKTIADADKTTTVAGVDNAAGASTTGKVTVSNLTAGSWKGAFNFNIALNTDFE